MPRYPVDKAEVLRIWTSLRHVFRVDLSKVTSPTELANRMRASKSTDVQKLAKLVDRSDFYDKLSSYYKIKSRLGPVQYVKTRQAWTPQESNFLLMMLNAPSRTLIKTYNYEFRGSPRTAHSILTKRSRVKKAYKLAMGKSP